MRVAIRFAITSAFACEPLRRQSLRPALVVGPHGSACECFPQSPALTGRALVAFIGPSDDGAEAISAITSAVLLSEFITTLLRVDRSELAALGAKSEPRNRMAGRIFSLLCVSGRIQWLHRSFLTNFSGFLPEITPFAACISACFWRIASA